LNKNGNLRGNNSRKIRRIFVSLILCTLFGVGIYLTAEKTSNSPLMVLGGLISLLGISVIYVLSMLLITKRFYLSKKHKEL